MRKNAYPVAVTVEAPPHNVFAVFCDVENWPKWTPTVQSVRPLSNVPFTLGSRYEVRQPRLRPAIWHESYVFTESQKLRLRCESAAQSAARPGNR